MTTHSDPSRPKNPPRDQSSGGCCMGLAWVFVLAGLVWPFLHLVGGNAEPDSFFIPVMIGGPAFLVCHILAFRALRSKSIEAAATARGALRLIWIGITILLLLGLGSFVFDLVVR